MLGDVFQLFIRTEFPPTSALYNFINNLLFLVTAFLLLFMIVVELSLSVNTYFEKRLFIVLLEYLYKTYNFEFSNKSKGTI